ncbi:MAG TPA: glycosyltransferase [Acidimicrobiia bacterium]|jgi:glycosyltransferase involved in cell wall biosynthesis
MRILFVCGGTGGGAAMSTHELADALADAGDQVRVVQSARGAEKVHQVQRRLLNASVKLARTPLAGVLQWGTGVVGRRTTVATVPGTREAVKRVTAPVVENAVPAALAEFRPDVVVTNSVDRASWRAVWRHAHHARVPVLLYIREESALAHVDDPQARPDAVVANAAALADGATARGVPAPFIASVVDLERSRVEPSRERVVFVNPIELNGLDLAIALAAECPDVPFTFVESWRLDDAAVQALTSCLAALSNVRFQRRSDDPRRSYADASVLLAPCLTDTRPRVVLEAQANGIPVLAADQPSLREAVGAGGATVAVDAPAEEWARALGGLLDPAHYDTVCDAARAYAQRDDARTEVIVARFRAVLEQTVERGVGGAS